MPDSTAVKTASIPCFSFRSWNTPPKEEAPKPKTAIEKLEYNSEKALERVDYYERVVRSVAREEEELKEYKNTVKNKK